MGMDIDAGSAVLEDHGSEVGMPTGAPPGSDGDAQLAAAIEASYHTTTDQGREVSEEELFQRALRAPQQEEDNRKRQELRDQQEQELAESVLMDQMREQREREQREAEEAVEQSRQDEARRAR